MTENRTLIKQQLMTENLMLTKQPKMMESQTQINRANKSVYLTPTFQT